MEEFVKFIHEVGSLKLTPRSGWLKIGIELPESVAEHSFRTAIIAFLLAQKSGESLEKSLRAAFLGLIHDLHETRTTDLHKIAKKYVKVDEERLENETMKFEIDSNGIEKYVEDADKLELAFQAVEYSVKNKFALEFAKKIEFKTEIAKEIYKSLMERMDPRWWR
ncbi:MAG: HD domain-containing protein [Archaeoglobaceae archaeon]|nr:HD domain-containing protein [Archaeoglobaceae archaeon]MDW8118079.1 HD domain-containing protein [Archaeoglobaceae archaeon]